MREDQLQRLNDLAEQLADVFLLEADPREWPGAGQSPVDWTTQIRGDRHWTKKNAMGTGGVLRYTLDLVKHHHETSSGNILDENDLDARIRDAEKRAKAAVNRALDKARKQSDERIGKG